MECVVCLDDAPPLLQNVCGCRGTIAAIHKTCLIQMIRSQHSNICKICKRAFTIQFDVVVPRAWHLLGSKQLEAYLWTFHILYWQIFGTILWGTLSRMALQYLVFGIYAWSLYPTIRPVLSWSYVGNWLKPIAISRYQHRVYPLFNLIGIAITLNTPCFPFFFGSYQKMWEIHCVICDSLGIL